MSLRASYKAAVAALAIAALGASLPPLATGASAQGEAAVGVAAPTVAWVGGSGAPPSGDRPLVRQLRRAGYDIALYNDDTVTPEAVDGADVVIISSSVVPAKVGASLAGIDSPILAMEPFLFEELGLAGRGGEATVPTTTLRIRPAVFGHPLLAGLIYRPTILTDPARLSFGFPGAGATVLARESGTGRPALFAYKTGDPLVDGTAAPAARVAFPIGWEAATKLNKSGRNLFAAAVKWLVESNVAAIQIVALNDFHGNLVNGGSITLDDGTRVNTGGAHYLATHVNALRATNPNTSFVSAGDLIGASPLISALFHDEPTIEAFNEMGLDLNAVGNHEFDEGATELLRMQNGGCHPVDGCLDGDPFEGAAFHFLAANVTSEATGETLFPAYAVQTFEGVDVAYIGMTLEGTPTIVTPSGVAGLDFADEADTVNALIGKLKGELGVEVVVVLIHEGGFPALGTPLSGCNGITGPIVDIVERTSDSVDLFITGHTHQNYVCEVDGRPVTSSRSFGRLVTDIDLSYDKRTGAVSTVIENIPVTQDVVPDPDLEALIAKYDTLSSPLADRIIGSIAADILRTQNAAGESPLGDVIADSQLAATATSGSAQIALMNPGGIRTDLLFAQISGTEAPGEVTYEEIFTVQPFGNSMVTLTLTGTQIDTVLEQQFSGINAAAFKILAPSAGFTYSWSASAPEGSKVDIASILLNGTPIDPAATYRVTVNSFLADGGDGFTELINGTDRVGGDVDLDALEAYFVANSPVPPGPLNRITQLP